ncbi:MAG: hypothetical protein ACYC6T_08165 [Thermoleophilia bacterium]
MTLTIRDLSEARRDDFAALGYNAPNRGIDVLVAVAEQLDLFERRYYEPTLSGRTDSTRRAEWDVARQIWEAAYEAAGGVVER